MTKKRQKHRPGFTATGTAAQYLPPGDETDEIMRLIRLGVAFRAQHGGKRPGPLANLILDCAKRAGAPYSFPRLLDELELDAARRELHGVAGSPIEKVDRVWQLLTVHLPKRGRVQVPFGTIQNHLTAARKSLLAEITVSAKS